MGERRQGPDVDGMDARQDLAELAGDPLAGAGVGRVAQELARDRGAADAAHDDRPRPARPRAASSNSTSGARTPACKAARKTRNSVARSSAAERSRFASALARRIAAQDQLVALAADQRIEAPGLARGAAEFAGETFDRGAAGEMPAGGDRQHGGHLIGFAARGSGHVAAM